MECWNFFILFGRRKILDFKKFYPAFQRESIVFKRQSVPHTGILKLSHSQIYLSGSPEDPHAGVGSAIPTPLLPIVYDFYPWNSRIAVLILNTGPHLVAFFIHLCSFHYAGLLLRLTSRTSSLGPPPCSFQSVQTIIYPNTYKRL